VQACRTAHHLSGSWSARPSTAAPPCQRPCPYRRRIEASTDERVLSQACTRISPGRASVRTPGWCLAGCVAASVPARLRAVPRRPMCSGVHACPGVRACPGVLRRHLVASVSFCAVDRSVLGPWIILSVFPHANSFVNLHACSHLEFACRMRNGSTPSIMACAEFGSSKLLNKSKLGSSRVISGDRGIRRQQTFRLVP
jgi:hypothetical protein